jgi:hypothetical protein
MSQQRRDFWFWVFGTVGILALFGSSFAYEFGVRAPWLPWITGLIALRATIGTGALLYADRKSRSSARTAVAPEEQYSPSKSARAIS